MSKRSKTPTFLLELHLEVNAGQAKRLRAHLEAGRQFYNAILSEGQKRLRQMRADPAWQEARAIPRTEKQQRHAAFSHLRKQYEFSEYSLHEFAKEARCSWLAEHLDAVLAQTLASRAYQALNRVCLGKAKRVRFKSRGRGLDSIENKRNDTGLRFVLQTPEAGHAGYLVWKEDQFRAIIDWNDPVVKYGIDHQIKYARLIRRKASSLKATGADCQGYRYFVQLALEGTPYQKPKHGVGRAIVGLDLGPSTIAIVPREGEARLGLLCEELQPDAKEIRRLQRKMDRQRRAANPEHYNEKGRAKKNGKKGLVWKKSQGYEATRRRKAAKERKLAAHRKSLHGHQVYEIVRLGNTIHLEKISYKGWQKRYGKSVGLRAPGMLIDHLRRTVASTGGILHDQTLAILPWLRAMHQKTALAALAPVCLWNRPSATGSLCGVSGGLSQSTRYPPLVCPVRRVLGRCGGAPAGSTRATHPTRESGAGLAPKHGHSPCRSASASKFGCTETRAGLSLAAREARGVEDPPGTPAALARGAISVLLAHRATNTKSGA
jgi:hypothetical protein